MYAIRELLVALIFAALASAALCIPIVILSCLYSAGQTCLARSSRLVSATSAAFRSWLTLLVVATRRAGQSIRESGLIPRPR